MRREINQKFLGQVIEVGRFVMGIGLGALISHVWSDLSFIWLGIALAGFGLWVLGAVIQPDHPNIVQPPPPQGGRGSASVENLPSGGQHLQWEYIIGDDK